MKRSLEAIVLALALSMPAAEGWAWGATGHEWVSGIAIEKLPDSVPAFVRSPEAAAEIAVMGRELDRSKGAGKTHDAERDPGHYVDLADDGTVMGVLPLAQLTVTREEYDTLLRAKGFTQYKAGYLPYSIVDGWQQIRKDFAYWRALKKGIETATSPEERAWFEADLRLREKLTLRDIGIWSHYPGDASQPLHVSVHYNGWATSRTPTATRPGRFTPISKPSSSKPTCLEQPSPMPSAHSSPAIARSSPACSYCCAPRWPGSRLCTASRRKAASRRAIRAASPSLPSASLWAPLPSATRSLRHGWTAPTRLWAIRWSTFATSRAARCG